MKVYFLKSNANSASFVHGKGYTLDELKQITGVFHEKILLEQVLLVFDEFDTDNTKDDELEVEIGILKRYKQTILFATRTYLNPLYPDYSFQLYVGLGESKRHKATRIDYVACLPLWLWTMIDTTELAEKDCHGDDITTILITVKDGQRVWDIMERMSVLEHTLK